MDLPDNQVNNLIQDSTTPRPQQLKLPNFLSSPMDNLTNYLKSVPPRSRSSGRKSNKNRSEGGAFAWTRVQSLDRKKREVAPIPGFRAMSMGVVCQIADPYQEEFHQDEEAQNDEADDEGQVDEDEEDDADDIASKDADCLIG